MPESSHDGAIILNLLIAGVLTLILGAIALLLLQRAILQNMVATSGQRRDPTEEPVRARWPAATPLTLVIATGSAVTAAGFAGQRLMYRAAGAHALAGFVFAVVAMLLLLTMSGMELFPMRAAVVVWSFAWPTVIVLCLLVGPDRRAQTLIMCGYLGGLLLLCTIAQLAGTPGLPFGGVTVPGFFQPMLLWAINAVPSLFLLLFLNRTIRTIGPLVLVFVFIVLIGSHIGLTIMTFEPVRDSVLTIAVASGVGGQAMFWSVVGVGMLAAVWPAWRGVAFLRDRYAAKRSSEFMITVGAIWLLQSLMLGISLSREQGALGAAAAVLPLAAWRFTLFAGLHPVVAAARSRPASRLLLLRVFGFGRRSRRLLDLLGSRWRLVGSIDLIAAPDLASRTVEPATFLEFIRGQLARLFIRTPDHLHQRLAAIDRNPDPDARFRVNQLFCSDDMWKNAVTRLMGEASLVVMDLRGFTPGRHGCVYELQTLLDTVPVGRLLFFIDRTTDRSGLESVLTEHWQRLDAASPNVTSETATLRLLDVSGSDAQAVRQLLAIAAPIARTG